MRPQDSTWQGCFGYWKNLFIRENLLPLGHAAWQGFITQGRGIVVCHVVLVDAKSVDWNSDIVEYPLQFVPLPNISAYLQFLNLEATLIDTFYDRPWQPNEPHQTRLVFIGRSLNSEPVFSALQKSTNAQPV
ncbi:hypothetical protein ACN4EK_26065 [Pantanalinema rosaneae CENA516]|uniref:hypothetical protein n=1 Tax=Pantanalinema rosaneae TaxID=1620701 RepID=UPI003D6F1D4D